MPKIQKDKYDILAEVALALRVENQKVVIETLDSEDTGNGFASYGDNSSYISTKRARTTMNGVVTLARLHAKSIKIGKDISIKRIHRKPSIIKTAKQEYEVDNGWYYVIRTPKGEAKFDRADSDFMAVWNYALSMHDGTDDYMRFAKNLRNEKVKAAAWGPMIRKTANADKYTEAIAKLKMMGIEPKKLAKYIQDKTGKEI